MAPLAEAAEGLASEEGLILIQAHDGHLSRGQKEIEIPKTIGTEACLHHDGQLHQGRSRHRTGVSSGNGRNEGLTLGLVLEDGQNRRRINHHQAGNPVLS